MNIEGYTTIKDFPDYMINNKGNIISFRRKTPVEIVGKISQRGYRTVGLRDVNGKRKHMLVHRLVAINYIPNPEQHPVINHKDGNQLNNCVENLEWCTISHNTQHAYDNGMIESVTKRVHLYKDNELVHIFEKKKTCVEYLVRETGMSFDHIRKIISGTRDKDASEVMKAYSFVVEE